MVKTRFWIMSLALLTVAFPQSACTLAGYGIGALVDSGGKRRWAPEAFATDTVKVGKTIQVRLRSGEELSGAYQGVEQVPEEQYVQRYESSRERHRPDFPLPALGDTVSLRLTRGSQLDIEFLGFDYQDVLVRSQDHSAPERVRPTEIAVLEIAEGAVIEGKVLALLLSEGTLPFRSALVLQAKPTIDRAGGRVTLPLDQVHFVETKSHGGRTAGILVGVTLDAALLTAAFICSASDCFDFSMGIGY